MWCIENPGIVGYLFEPTYGMINKILIPTLERDILLGSPLESNPLIVGYNKSDKRIQIRAKGEGEIATLWLGSLEKPEMAEGPNIDFAMIDEARLVRYLDTAIPVLRRRIRGSVPGKYPTGLWFTTTPDAPGSVLHTFFENPKTRNPESKIYRLSTMENKYLTEEYQRDVNAAHTGGLAERFLYGRFAQAGGTTWKIDYTVHILPEIDTTILKNIAYGVDFGWTNPTAVLAIGFDGDGRAYVLDEFYKTQVRNEELAGVLHEFCRTYGKGTAWCDSSEPATIDFLKRSGIDARPKTNKREDGIREVGGRLEKAGDGRPRLYIHSRCVDTIDEFQTYDEKKKEHDHLCDAAMYCLAMSAYTAPQARTTPIYVIAKRYDKSDRS